MSSGNRDEDEVPTVHAGSVAPGPSPSSPPANEIEDDAADGGWSSPEAAPPPEQAPNTDVHAEDSVGSAAEEPEEALDASDVASKLPPPPEGEPAVLSVPAAPPTPTIVEGPVDEATSTPPVTSPSGAPGSRKLAPPPKPKKSAAPESNPPEAATPLVENTPYAQPVPPAPGLPHIEQFSAREPGSADKLLTLSASLAEGERPLTQPTSSQRVAPPRPNASPPLTRSHPPPAFLAALEQGELFKSPPARGAPPAEAPPPAAPPAAEVPPPEEAWEPDTAVDEGDRPSVPNVVLDAAASVAGAATETPSMEEPPVDRPSAPPPPPMHVVVPTDDVPPPSKPMAAPAIHVMRIIAVGSPQRAEPPPGRRDEPEDLSGDDITEEALPEALARGDEAEMLSEDDVAPDSGREDAISIPPEEVELPDETSAKADGKDAKPPPPPRRPQQSQPAIAEGKAPDAPPPIKSKRQKRPWWEEMFGEDFVRSSFKISDAQVRREVNFIEESLGVAPGGVVLDLGCGSGHHAVELAGRGYGVVGYDLSLYQLALAAEVAQEKDQKLNFLQGDMREMAFEEMFDGIYCWNTTFGYFEEEKNLNVAERVFRALKPGGMFLVDVVNRDFAAVQSPSSLWFEGDSCVCMDDMSVDFISSRLRVKRAIILDDGRTKECNYSIRLYTLHELGTLLHDVGFRVAEASGHPNMPGVFFGPNSPRIIILAQKPENG